MNTVPDNLPCDTGMEKAFLGTMLSGGEQAVAAAMDQIKPDDLLTPAHADLYRVLIEMLITSKPLEGINVRRELETRGMLERIGGSDFLQHIQESYWFEPTNLAYHCNTLVGLSKKRRLISLAVELRKAAYAPLSDAADLIDGAQEALGALSVSSARANPLCSAAEAVDEAIDHSSKVAAAAVSPGLMTGLDAIDAATGGWAPGDLVVLGAKTSAGKSALAQKIIVNVCRGGGSVFFASAEMKRRQVAFRLLSIMADIDGRRLRAGAISPEEALRRDEAAAEIRTWRMAFYDAPSTIAELAVRARYLVAKWKAPLSLIGVDYLQLEKASRGDNRAQQIGNIAWDCKELANRFDCPVLLLSQLNRAGVKDATDEAPPGLHDLKESGDIENHSNSIILLHRPKDARNYATGMTTIWAKIAKSREGPTTPWPNPGGYASGAITLSFKEESTRFESGDPQ